MRHLFGYDPNARMRKCDMGGIMIPKLGPMELVVILIVVLLIFGPKNRPKLGRAIGKSVTNLREGLDSGKKDKAEQKAAEVEEQVANPEPAVKAVEEEAEVVLEGKPAPKSAPKGPYEA